MNSFKYGCVVNGKWYCNRPFLERELSKFVASGQTSSCRASGAWARRRFCMRRCGE